MTSSPQSTASLLSLQGGFYLPERPFSPLLSLDLLSLGVQLFVGLCEDHGHLDGQPMPLMLPLQRVPQGDLELEPSLSAEQDRGYNAYLLLSPYKTFSWERPDTDTEGPTAKVVSSGERSTHTHYHFSSNSLERIYSL